MLKISTPFKRGIVKYLFLIMTNRAQQIKLTNIESSILSCLDSMSLRISLMIYENLSTYISISQIDKYHVEKLDEEIYSHCPHHNP